MEPEPIIRICGLVNQFGDQRIHDHLNLEIYRGEVLGIVGGSGTGKSVLLHSILGLHQPNAGEIIFMGTDLANSGDCDLGLCQSSWGVLFQNGALFSSLTVLENIQVPIWERTQIDRHTSEELALLKMKMVGLSINAADKNPSELSGGMVKRVALARALAIDPKIIFLDEPTAGLDPIAASEFDQLILYLSKNLDLTVVMITHDLDSLFTICDRVAVLVDKNIIVEPTQDIVNNRHPWIQEYFGGPRSDKAMRRAENG